MKITVTREFDEECLKELLRKHLADKGLQTNEITFSVSEDNMKYTVVAIAKTEESMKPSVADVLRDRMVDLSHPDMTR